MQDKQPNDFDLQLRSILEDAEVRPSRRVWRAVSARLDADAGAAASPWGWMKWAGMSLAAAAAIAAGVFFSGTRNSIPTIIHNPEQAQLAQTGEPAGTPARAELPAAVPAEKTAAEIAARTSVPRHAASRQSAARPEQKAEAPAGQTAGGASAPVAAPAAQPEEHAAEEHVAARPAQGTPSGQESGRFRPAADPFAGPDPAASRRTARPRTAIYAQGMLGTNDADPRSVPAARIAPGTSAGFSELGPSTYGVPFTVGLGVRFYLAPRFSVATGLDYSLLTRTFTGSFEGVSGTVSHTLHYLGIPVNLYYDVLNYDKFKFYVYGGGEAEWCLNNKYRLFASPDIIRTYPVSGAQFSVGGGIGVEFRLTRNLGLYLDPGVTYYFPGNQPRSVRTDKPLLLRFDAGLRFNFGNQNPQ